MENIFVNTEYNIFTNTESNEFVKKSITGISSINNILSDSFSGISSINSILRDSFSGISSINNILSDSFSDSSSINNILSDSFSDSSFIFGDIGFGLRSVLSYTLSLAAYSSLLKLTVPIISALAVTGSLLIHSDAENDSTDILDSSGYDNVITNYGVVHKTAEHKIGSSSMYFDGTSYFYTPHFDDFYFGLESFSIDFWIKRDRIDATENICGQMINNSLYASNMLVKIYSNNNKIVFTFANESLSYYKTYTPEIVLNDLEWHHISFNRLATEEYDYFYYFCDGILTKTEKNDSTVFPEVNSNFYIGKSDANTLDGFFFKGFIDEFRIAKYEHIRVKNFTPETLPYGTLDGCVGCAPIKSGIYEIVKGILSLIENIGSSSNFNILTTLKQSELFYIKNQYGTYLESLLSLLNEVKGIYEDRTSAYTQALNNVLLVNDPLSNNQFVLSSSELLTSHSNLLSIIAEGFNSYLSIITKLNLNDPLVSDQLIKSTFELLTSRQDLLSIIAEGFNSYLSVITKLNLNDPLVNAQMIMSSSELISSRQDLLSIITEGFNSYLNITNKLNLNDPLVSDQLIKSTFELLTSTNTIENIISEGKNDKQSIVNILSTSVEQNQKVVNDISNLSDLIKSFLIKNSILEAQIKFYSYNVKVYLDGTDISKLVSSDITIEKDQGNIHNSISFSSVSEVLFNKADPSVLEGQIRIEVQIDSSVMYFLLEERSFASDGTVSYWGRDATARDNSPWSNSINVVLDKGRYAKDLVESLGEYTTMYSVIDWEIFDWQLPNTFEATGTPVEIISIIASEIGAIVRAQDDGSLLVRYAYPIRPVNVKTAQAVYSFSSDIIYDESFSEENGGWYNQVIVTSDTADKKAPILELEDVVDGERTIGTTSYVRAFYYEDPSEASSITSQDATDGIITFVKKDVEEITEIITFSNGTGNSSYPLKTLKNISWLGRENIILTWNDYSTDITLETESYCLAEITYDAEYHRYKASGHSVQELLTVFEIESTYFSSILVKTEAIASVGDKEGDEITTSYLTEEYALVKRGENWIDDNKYNTKIISFNSPFISTVKDGDVIWLDISKVPSGNYQVISNGIIISGPKVINNMTVKQWEV